MKRGLPFRELVPSCKTATSFRYYFEKEKCGQIWELLEKYYGPIRRNDTFKTQEIEAEYLHFRATFAGNPILILRKRGWKEEDVHELHELLHFKET